MGVSRMRTPKGASALSIADITAAAAGMTPASPTPLTPRGLTVEGVSWWMISTFGTTGAVGRRYSANVVVTGCPASS